MRPIKKHCSPKLMGKYKELLKKEKNPNFEQLQQAAGNELNHSLAREQGFICCYCMNEITERKDKEGKVIQKDGLPWLKMKIEHFKSQKNNKKAVTDYKNLLCACQGGCVSGEKKGKEKSYCDSYKLEDDFVHIKNPAAVKVKDFDRAFQLRYNYEGKIRSIDKDIDKELNTILNLNVQTLKKMRKAAWDSISTEMTKHCKKSNWADGEAFAKDLIIQYQNRKKEDDKFFRYSEMIIFLLKKRFKNLR